MVESQPPKKPQSSSLQGSQRRSAGLNCAVAKAEGRVTIFKTEKNINAVHLCGPYSFIIVWMKFTKIWCDNSAISNMFKTICKHVSSSSPFIHAKGEV